jgi:hypothetical protein
LVKSILAPSILPLLASTISNKLFGFLINVGYINKFSVGDYGLIIDFSKIL